MKTILTTLASSMILIVSVASPALAAPKGGHSSGGGHHGGGQVYRSHSNGPVMQANKFVAPAKTTLTTNKVSQNFNKVNQNFNKVNGNKFINYHLTNGQKFAHGYFYSGRNHRHWCVQRWDARYGCECYFDEGCGSWYYWCEPACCFYPISYCPYRTYCCWNTVVIEPSTGPCLPCGQGPLAVPVDGTVEPPMETDGIPTIPAPLVGLPKQ